ncbi:flagellar biosynthesis protein [bacterium D16-76]|nr:flagellar biosynthesis protein [bacterium D16-76]
MIEKVAQGAAARQAPYTQQVKSNPQGGFGAMLQGELQKQVNFSKHAMCRAEERGIQLTPDLMEKLAGSVEKAQEKGAKNILAFDATQAFIINVPYGRVITTMSGEEMKENIFTNIDGAVLL